MDTTRSSVEKNRIISNSFWTSSRLHEYTFKEYTFKEHIRERNEAIWKDKEF